jgi:two-component SAPR family response regulator
LWLSAGLAFCDPDLLLGDAMPRDCLVLVLEDEVFVSSLIEMMLQDHGCVVGGPFRSNRLALEYLDQTRPDVALIDFNIADGNSEKTASRLTELGVPFVVVSGYPKSMAKCGDLTKAEWLDKPFSEERVIQSLRAAMSRGVSV